MRGENESDAGFVRGDGFGLEVDAGREVFDGESDGFVEAGFPDDKELDAGGAALADDGRLAGEGFILLMRVPRDGDEPVAGSRRLNAELGRGGMTELIEEGEAVWTVGGRVEADGGVCGAHGEVATAVGKRKVIVGGDLFVLRSAVLIVGDLLDDQEGVGRITKAGRQEFDPERLIFFGFEGMVGGRFGKSKWDVFRAFLNGKERGGVRWNGFGGSDEAVGMFAAAGEGEVVNFKEVSAGCGGFESECGVAVEGREVVGPCEFGTIGGKKDECRVEARVDGLGLAVKVDGLIMSEGELVVVDGSVVGMAIDDGVEGEVFSGFGRVVGPVLFFGKVTDHEGPGSGEAEAGLG